MRQPLNNWDLIPRGYRFGVPTSYSARHLGVDYAVPKGTPVYAPTDGQITVSSSFPEGGNTIWFAFSNLIMRCLHLRQLSLKTFYREGDIIAYTGNTGRSTGPHLHIDLSRDRVDLNNFNNFIDPDVFFAGSTIDETMKITDQNVNDLYLAVFRRPADEAGRRYWIGRDVMEFIKMAPQQTEWRIYTPLIQAGKLVEEFGRNNR